MGLLAKVGRPFSCSFVANLSGLSFVYKIPILPGAAVPESLVSRPQLVALSDPRSTGVDGVNGNSNRKMEKYGTSALAKCWESRNRSLLGRR